MLCGNEKPQVRKQSPRSRHESPVDSRQSTDQCGVNACSSGRMGTLAHQNPAGCGNAVGHGNAVGQECPTSVLEFNKVLGPRDRYRKSGDKCPFRQQFGGRFLRWMHVISGCELNQTFRNVSIVRQAAGANFSGRVLRCCVGLNLPGSD
jgi:hypothetical protein